MKTTRSWPALCLAAVTSLALVGCGGGFEEEGGGDGGGEAGGDLTVLIGTSGEAETKAVKDAVAAWSEDSGTQAKVSIASDLFTLTKGVAQLASGALSAGSQYPVKLAAAAIMTIPVAIVFFIFQRRIMNTQTGAVKE